MTGDPQVPCFFTIYKIEKSFISIQKFECIIITLCVKTWGILAKEKNNYVFSCIEYLQSMKPCVEPIKKKKEAGLLLAVMRRREEEHSST